MSPVCRTTATLLFLIVVMSGCEQEPEQEWQLPVHLGDSQAHVYRILGEPSQVVESPPDEINWFKDAGLTITLDSARNVSGITIHGPWNSRRFSTYQEPVLSGLRVTDKVVDFFTKFGRPVQRKNRWHESEASVVWQRAHLLIEVTYWTMETEIGASGASVNVGELSRIDITPAPRSQ